MRESALSRKIQNALRDRGAFVFKVHGNEFTMVGLPDLVICYRGYYIGLEVKNPETGYAVTPRQEYIHNKIREAGGICLVIKSAGEAIALLSRIDQQRGESPDLHNANIQGD